MTTADCHQTADLHNRRWLAGENRYLAPEEEARITPTLIGMTVELILESEITDVERPAVAEVFESAGIQADVQGRLSGILR